MWHIENSEDNSKVRQAKPAQKTRSKGKSRKTDSILYLYVQVAFSLVMVVTSFMLKGGNSDTFEYAKQGYTDFFEKESYLESNFSYNTFAEKMKTEIEQRFEKLVEVFNNINGKGSAGYYPQNVSTEKYVPRTKGVVPVQGYISSPYGERQDPFNSKKRDFHTGLDIACPKGSFIKSAYSGRVIDSGYSDIAGNYIRMECEEGIVTLYAHCQFLFVKTGERVLQNQVIATAGQTGRATGPHLHFEFIVEGTRYNPIYAIEI